MDTTDIRSICIETQDGEKISLLPRRMELMLTMLPAVNSLLLNEPVRFRIRLEFDVSLQDFRIFWDQAQEGKSPDGR